MIKMTDIIVAASTAVDQVGTEAIALALIDVACRARRAEAVEVMSEFQLVVFIDQNKARLAR